MKRTRWLFAVSLGVGWLLGGCGSSQEPTRQDQTMGGVKEGAPLGRSVADPGILAEGAGYQPAKLPAGAEAAPVAGRRAEATPKRADSGADADTQVKAAVRNLVNNLKDGEIEVVLRSFDAEQVAPLLDKVDPLLNTYEKVGLLQRHLAKKMEPAKAEELTAPLRGGEANLKWEILDPNHASISPNLTQPLFGPKATPSLELVREGGEWRFQLAAPLTAADVEEILAFHQQLQKALDAIVEWVATSATVDEAQLQTLIGNALRGEPVEPQATASKAEPEGEKDQKEEAKPKAAGGKGARPK